MDKEQGRNLPMRFCKLKKLLAYRINNSSENRNLEKVETVTLSQKYVVIPIFTAFISSCSILKPAGTENEVPLLSLGYRNERNADGSTSI